MEPSMKYRGGEAFKGLFSYLGAVRMKKGCRIVTNTNEGGDWLKVLYSSTYGEIYVLKEEIHSTIKDSASFIDYDGEWPRSWKGEKYVNFKLAYEGEFYFMMKHTEFTDKSKEYVQLTEGFEVYYGGFKYDKRHTKQNQQGSLEITNKNSAVKKLKGIWSNDKKHGQFTKNQQPHLVKKSSRGLKMRIVGDTIFYFNDIQVSEQRKPKHQGKAIKQFDNQFNLQITLSAVHSTKQQNCLFSEMMDLFFKHLSYSFQKYEKKSKNMQAFTIFTFQKLVPSNQVSKQKPGQVSINYEAVKSRGQVYKNLSSIFEVNPLILMPLNRDRSHFALGAISTHVVRNKLGKLQQVKFDLYYLDSLHNTQKAVPEILRQYIKKQISENITQQKHIYLKAADQAVQNFKELAFSRQKNEVDCGVFTCIYGFLLTVEVCSSKKYKINWNWDSNQSENDSVASWLRKLMRQDAYLGIHNYFELIQNQFIKRKILEKSRFKMSND